MAYNQKNTAGRGNMPKTGRGIPVNMVNPIMQKKELTDKPKEKVSIRNNQASSDKAVEAAAAKKLKQKVKDVAGAGRTIKTTKLSKRSHKRNFFWFRKTF